jgi:catechol 2,3-dioxygenase-like lactoylglutathione lyase family enzyme
MNQSLAHVALVVRDYDEAIDFYVGKLGFDLVEDSYQPDQDKRWVVVRPKRNGSASLLLARAATPHQERYVGDQCGGRVFLFLRTDDFWRDFNALVDRGVEIERPPKAADYGIVAVFRDLYGNLWDLVQFTDGRA